LEAFAAALCLWACWGYIVLINKANEHLYKVIQVKYGAARCS